MSPRHVIKWTLWLVAVAVSFGLLEAWGYEEGETLSAFIANLNEIWPLVGPLFGLVAGVLLAHFFWPWLHPRLRK